VSLEQQLNNWVVPDYLQDLTQIFIEVSTLLLRKLPILSVLYMVAKDKGKSSLALPSWVPDFSCPTPLVPLIYACEYYASKLWDGLDDRGKSKIFNSIEQQLYERLGSGGYNISRI
jgi:hypothetical protein